MEFYWEQTRRRWPRVRETTLSARYFGGDDNVTRNASTTSIRPPTLPGTDPEFYERARDEESAGLK